VNVFLQHITNVWRQATMLQRTLLLSLVLVGFGALALVGLWVGRTEMALLYNKLEREDAAKIVERLQDEDIAYKLRDSGTTIYVPKDKVYSLRLKMAGDGLPVGGSAGYKILDNQELGASPFLQKKNYIRALEGELARTIRMIDGVQSARVHVVQPDSVLFAGPNRKSTASVVVAMRNKSRLDEGHVAAIVNLVAGSVEGLAVEDVSVVDDRGNLLSRNSDPLAAKAETIHDYKTRVEQELARKAEEVLAVALGGPGRSRVRVTAEVDTTSLTTRKTEYNPAGRVIEKALTKTKTESTPPEGEGTVGGRSGEETIEEEDRVSEVVEERQEGPGRINRLSVAAVVDLSPPPGVDANEPVMSLEQAKNIISRAIGLKESDTIEVVATKLPLSTPLAAGTAPEGPASLPGPLNTGLEILKRSSLGILVIGVLIAMRMFAKPKKKKGALPGAAAGALAAQGAQGQNALEGPDGGSFQDKVNTAMTSDPDQVKKVFMSWLEGESAQ
jgi:flagellar M-ring protein FliF